MWCSTYVPVCALRDCQWLRAWCDHDVSTGMSPCAHRQNQMLDSAVCGCILIPKSGLRRVLYMGCCILVFISLLFALPQITW